MLLYTDGVTDTPGAGDRFGHERLSAILQRRARSETGEVLERIEAALREFQAGTAVDDRAMLVLRFTGERKPPPPARRVTTIFRRCLPLHPRPARRPAGR